MVPLFEYHPNPIRGCEVGHTLLIRKEIVCNSDPVAFFSINNSQVIIDEAYQYPEIFKTLRGAVDADRKKKGRLIITGSSTPTIIKEITESLAGRIATIELWPFKQSEYHEKRAEIDERLFP